MKWAAMVAVALLVVVALFQAALALGAPWASAAWGGRHQGRLPGHLRIASGLAAIGIYPLIAILLLDAVGLFQAPWLPATGESAIWVLTGAFTLGAVANFVSRSPRERYWGFAALAIAVCCFVIARKI